MKTYFCTVVEKLAALAAIANKMDNGGPEPAQRSLLPGITHTGLPMSPVLRPRRSVLYMPGINPRAIAKARALPADSLVLDLEDSVGPARKEEAREQVLAELAQGGFGRREVVVRINRLDTPWGEADARAVAATGAAAVCLPKVESAAEIHALAALLQQHRAPASMAIWAMIETPLGVLRCADIAAAGHGLQVLAMGTTDLAKELRVPHTPQRLGLLTALGSCVLAARAHQLDILDGVYLDLEDEAGFRQACEQGRELGFDGKTLIHPRQLAAANAVFAPDPQALVRAEKIIVAWQQAEQAGSGVVVVDGQLVEAMHIDEARRQLAIAAMIED